MLPNDLKRAKSYSDHGSDLPRQERHQDAPAPASPPRSLGRQLMVGRRHRYLRNAAILTIIAVARLGSGIGLLSAAGKDPASVPTAALCFMLTSRTLHFQPEVADSLAERKGLMRALHAAHLTHQRLPCIRSRTPYLLCFPRHTNRYS